MSDSSPRRKKDPSLEEVAARSTLRVSTVAAIIGGVVGPLATALTIFFVWEKDVVKTKDLEEFTTNLEKSLAQTSEKLDRLARIEESHKEVLVYLYGRATGQPLHLQPALPSR